MAGQGNFGANEGFHVLDDFACTAIPSPNIPRGKSTAIGMNADMDALTELPPNNADRAAELRMQSNAQLLALLRISPAALSAEELRIIHDIAIERLVGGNGHSEGADELSREAMRVFVQRIPS